MISNLKKFRRTANIGLYGSIAAVILTVIFHYSPFHITYQQPQVARWMLIAGTILAVLAIVMVLMTIRKTTPKLRQLDNLNDKLTGYTSYICNLYSSTFAIVLIECVLIVLMSDTSLLMVTILLVLMLFLSYPNMYKMKNDLGLTDSEMTALFGDAYIADATPFEAKPDLPSADAQLTIDAQQSAADSSDEKEPTSPTEEKN